MAELILNTTLTTTSVQTSVICCPPQSPDDARIRQDINDDVERLFFQQAEISLKNAAAYGAHIILTAALHYLSGLNAGGVSAVNGPQVCSYVTSYLKGYDAAAIWGSLRCGLFHRGVPTPDSRGRSSKAAVLSAGGEKTHDPDGSRNVSRGHITIDVECYLRDLRNSLRSLLAAAERNPEVMCHLRESHAKYRPVPFAVTAPISPSTPQPPHGRIPLA